MVGGAWDWPGERGSHAGLQCEGRPARGMRGPPALQDTQAGRPGPARTFYVQGRGSLREELKKEHALRQGRTRRIPRSRLGAPGRGARTWVHGANISARPPTVEDRAVPGHWEEDLIVGAASKTAAITLVERTHRFTLIHPLPLDHSSPTVITARTREASPAQEGEEPRTARIPSIPGGQLLSCLPPRVSEEGWNPENGSVLRIRRGRASRGRGGVPRGEEGACLAGRRVA